MQVWLTGDGIHPSSSSSSATCFSSNLWELLLYAGPSSVRTLGKREGGANRFNLSHLFFFGYKWGGSQNEASFVSVQFIHFPARSQQPTFWVWKVCNALPLVDRRHVSDWEVWIWPGCVPTILATTVHQPIVILRLADWLDQNRACIDIRPTEWNAAGRSSLLTDRIWNTKGNIFISWEGNHHRWDSIFGKVDHAESLREVFHFQKVWEHFFYCTSSVLWKGLPFIPFSLDSIKALKLFSVQ